MKNAIILLLALLCLQVKAQTTKETKIIDYMEPATYEIGNIKVTGANFADEAAIISISGLKVGQQVTIPGDKINNAMKAIWNLHLFKDLEIRKVKTIDDVVFLEIEVFEFSRIGGYFFTGVKKSNLNELKEAVRDHLIKGRIFTEHNRTNVVLAIKEFYAEKGYPNAVIFLKETPDPILQNAVQLNYDIDKRDKVKVLMIDFEGNQNISDRKLKKLMEFTNEKKKLFKKSILTETGFEEDKKNPCIL